MSYQFEYTNSISGENIASSLIGILESDKLKISSIGLTSTLQETFRSLITRPPIQKAIIDWHTSSLSFDSTVLQSTCDTYLSSLSSAYLEIPIRWRGFIQEVIPSDFILRSSIQANSYAVNEKITVTRSAVQPHFSTLSEIIQLRIHVEK